MQQNTVAARKKFPSFYRQDWLTRRREELGLSEREVARLAGIHYSTAQQVFAGKATGTKVYPVCMALGMDWIMLHDLKPPASEYRRAVVNGGSRSSSVRKPGRILGEVRPGVPLSANL